MESLAKCMEKEHEEISVHQAITRETLEELKPEERQFRMEMAEWIGGDDGLVKIAFRWSNLAIR